MRTIKKKLLLVILALGCIIPIALMFIPFSASADNGKSMTLTCVKDGNALEGMKWKLYRIGERKDGEFVLTGEFSGFPVDLKDMSVRNIMAAAQTLEGFTIQKNTHVLANQKTGKDGTVTFTGLSNGLYLAIGKKMRQGVFTYEPSPLLLEINDESTGFNFDAYPKIVKATLASEATSHTVKKVWLDFNDNYEARPIDITVDLYRDEELFDTVVLSEANNWEHKWVSLDAQYDWRVVERTIPVDYQVRVEYNETQYLVCNRHVAVLDWDEFEMQFPVTTTAPPPVVTGDEGSMTGETIQTADRYTETSTVTADTTQPPTSPPPTSTAPPQSAYTGGGRSKLPQTGQLWWPVVPLGFGGTVMLFTGIKLKSDKDEDEEE